MPRRFTLPIVITFVLAATAACTYRGDAGNPVARNLTWFSYLNGDDIRNECKAGQSDRYRFVYNGIYNQQVRSYDVKAGSKEGGPLLRIHVLGLRGDISTLSLDKPSSLLDPWAEKTEVVHLRPQDLAQLRDAMQAGGVFTPLSKHLDLPSESFYWVTAACRDGVFAFNAYRWPSSRFDHAAFPKLLFAWDPTGIPVNPPRKVTMAEIYGRVMSPSDMRRVERFDLTADSDGLMGFGALF